jgi:hypothetical protein
MQTNALSTQTAMQQLAESPTFMPQPLYWDVPPQASDTASPPGSARRRVLNLRKLRELVPSLVGAGLLDAAREVLLDLLYCKVKADAGCLHALMDEFAAMQAARLQSDANASRSGSKPAPFDVLLVLRLSFRLFHANAQPCHVVV